MMHSGEREKISPTSCLGGRTCRPLCACCGGSMGIRAARRKPKAKRAKPKYKMHRLVHGILKYNIQTEE